MVSVLGRDPGRTASVMDQDGWFHTGDVGEFLTNGTLRIIDQKKLVFKLSRGEYVAPDKVEEIYQASPYIAQVRSSFLLVLSCTCLLAWLSVLRY